MTKKVSNHHILEAYDLIHTKDEVSMNIHVDRRAYNNTKMTAI